MNLILIAVISLGAIALVLAAILYVASKKFAVYEDPRIATSTTVCLGQHFPHLGNPRLFFLWPFLYLIISFYGSIKRE